MTTVDASTGVPAAELLSLARGLVDPALRAAVGTLPDSMRRVAAYHLGWGDAGGDMTGATAGKAVRAALVLQCAAAVGGNHHTAVPAAAAVELVHNATLLHDDVMDRDRDRRHRPAAWAVFGVNDAILAGDALLLLASRVVAAIPAAVDRLAGCVAELCDGQSADLAFEHRADVGLDECVAMVAAKTGALLGCACALGAHCGGADREVVAAFEAFGRQLGAAFQLVDDLLGIWGDPAMTGKPVFSDLASRKKTLLVVATLTSGTVAGDEFAKRYRGSAAYTHTELAHLAELVQASGAREWAQRQAARHRAAAVGRIRQVAGPQSLRSLGTLADLLTSRQH